MIREPKAEDPQTQKDGTIGFNFTNEGGPLPLPAPAQPGTDRADLLPKPQNGWRCLFQGIDAHQIEVINAFQPMIDEGNRLSAWAHRNEHVLRVARAVHQCENVERMAVERFNQLLECARRIVRPRATSPDFEYHRYRDPTLFINDLKLVEGDLKLLDAMGKTLRNRLITGYLISQSSFDFKAIDLIGSPTGGFDDDEMEFIRLLSVPYKAFAPLLAAQMETIIENIGIVDDRYYELCTIKVFTGYTDHRETWARVKSEIPTLKTPDSDLRFRVSEDRAKRMMETPQRPTPPDTGWIRNA